MRSRNKSGESPGSDGSGGTFISPLHHTCNSSTSSRQRGGSATITSTMHSHEWFKWLPRLYSSCPDPSVPNQTLCISAEVCPDQNSMCFSALDFNGGCYTVVLNPTQLERIKPSHMSIPNFFSSMAKQFDDQSFKVYRSGAKVMLILKDDVCFQLLHVEDSTNTLWTTIFNAYDSINLRTCGDPNACTFSLVSQVQKVKGDIKKLEEKKADLHKSVQQCEQEEQEQMQKYTTLQTELVQVTQQYHHLCEIHGFDPKDFEGPVEPPTDGQHSYGRPPLDTDARDFDIRLMALIKSGFSSIKDTDSDASCESGSPKSWCKVVHTLSRSEYSRQMSMLPEGKTAKVMECLEKIDCWDFDVWTMQDMTCQGSLFYTAYALFLKWDLFRKLDIDEQIAINFFSQVEAGYHPNPYHNSVHGADVMHILHYIMGKGKCKNELQLQDYDMLAMLIAGMIHDFDHPGLNNNFHIKIQSYLATLYNDRSMLENHHLAEVFDLMKTPKFNILHSLNPQQYSDVRETMIEVVLFTDMQLHAKVLGNWKRRLARNHRLSDKKEDQRLALSMCIKMADISNCCRPLDMYLKWSNQLVEEFFLQGDNEKARGDQISPFMDRQQPYMGKSQVAFMNYVVIPMYESITEFLPEMGFSIEIALSNVAYWKNQKEIKMAG